MQKQCTSTNGIHYREPENNNVQSDAQQLLSGALQIDEFGPIKELERIRTDGQQALTITHFSTPHERKTAELVQRNTDGWIDTAKDVLTVGVGVAGLVTTCAPAINAGIMTTEDLTLATQHANSVQEGLRRIYNRSCEMAINNSNELIEAVCADENTKQNLTIQTAVERHQSDLDEFRQGKVGADVPHRSHNELYESIRNAEPNSQSKVRQKAEQSSCAWKTATPLGGVLLAAGLLLGFVLLKK